VQCCVLYNAAHPLGGLLLLLDAAADEAPLLLLMLQDGDVLAAMLAHSLLKVPDGEDAACVALRRCRTAASAAATQREHGIECFQQALPKLAQRWQQSCCCLQYNGH
jgi:hypothetical protein